MAKPIVAVSLRLEPEMFELLKEFAARNRRSLNGEVVFRIKQAMEADGFFPAPTTGAPVANPGLSA